MASRKHVDLLRQGTAVWNAWRAENPSKRPNLRGAEFVGPRRYGGYGEIDLRGADLRAADLSETRFENISLDGADFREAWLRNAVFSKCDATKVDFRGANLTEVTFYANYAPEANFSNANLQRANFSYCDLTNGMFTKAKVIFAHLYGNFFHADFSEANLNWSDLSQAQMSGTNLRGALLMQASLVETNLRSADLTGCSIYGISAWNVELEDAIQQDLKITQPNEPTITVDNLEVAQFMYLLLNNNKVRQVIDTITSKVVLILGRFTTDRKAILNAIREELRLHNYLPVLFDFDKPVSRDITETIAILAHMARFVIADITDAKSIPQELQRIVPDLPSVPVQPLLHISGDEYGMFEHFKRYPWVLQTYEYVSLEELIASLKEKVIAPAETKAKELLSEPNTVNKS